jgi:ubiquinone/menaquinone biosynthesis C-methylase UbiE
MPGTSPASIYDDAYAERYDALYLHPWRQKHEANLRHLARLLADLPPRARWLDLACGQAWHFAQFPDAIAKLGVDLSLAQLRRARRRSPGARFVQADMSRVAFPGAAFDLVTAFWAGYCYLDDEARIEALFREAAGWIRPGGALYVEVLPPSHLASFNASRCAAATSFRVLPRTLDYGKWAYEDSGGTHEMTSPPVERFLEWLAPAFAAVESQFDGGFMVDVIARHRLAPPARG